VKILRSDMKPKPLPCPFCGAAPQLCRSKVDYGGSFDMPHYLYRYVCQDFNCCAELRFGEWSKSEALKRWNRRFKPKRKLSLASEPAEA